MLIELDACLNRLLEKASMNCGNDGKELGRVLQIIKQQAEALTGKTERNRIKEILVKMEEKDVNKKPSGKLSLEISSPYEDALQRAIYNSRNSVWRSDSNCFEVVWGDAEVPAHCFRLKTEKNPKSGTKGFDLVGISDNTYVFCELKMGENRDKLSFAILELLSYYACFLQNGKDLVFHYNSYANLNKWNKNNKLQKNKIMLAVAADSSWWGKREETQKKLELKLELDLYLLKIPLNNLEDLFTRQKQESKEQGDGTYTPFLPENPDWQILKKL